MSDNQISDMSPVCGQIIKNMKRRILFAKNFFLVGLLLLTSLQVIAQKARVMITTENNSKLLSETILKTTKGRPASNYVRINTDRQYQTVDGFGFALTGGTCYNLMRMSVGERVALLKKIFSERQGYGASYVRISIGCSDFSLSRYTLCDVKGIENFALQSEEIAYVIPILKEVQAINPKLKIIAAPWTAPKWMKVSQKNGDVPYDNYVGGHLNKTCYSDYADYFVRFLKAMKNNGITIHAVTPQNEPGNGNNEGGAMLMDVEEEIAFVKVLATAFHNAGLSTKIYLFDHNFNNEQYAEQVAKSLRSSSFLGDDLVEGAAFHNYGGDPTAMATFYNNTGLKSIYTESSIGSWNDGRNLNGKLCGEFNWSGLRALQNQSSAFIAWNLLLDYNGHPTTLSNSTVYGNIEIDPSSYALSTVRYNRDYYIICHLSSVIRPGAVRCDYIENGVPRDDWDFNYVALRNSDGTTAFVISNKTSVEKHINLASNSEYVNVDIPAKSVVSVLLGDTEQNAVTFGGMEMNPSDNRNSFSINTYLEKGKTYTAVGDDAFSSPDFYEDPDFFIKLGNGRFKFTALSGYYNIKFVPATKSFRIYASHENGNPLSLNADGTGALWAIGSDGLHKPYYSIISNQSWWTDTDHATCMAPVGNKRYQLTLTAGRQLNVNNVDFKFFGQAGWGVELNPTGEYRISSRSDVFLIGHKAVNGHSDGNVYVADGVTLQEGRTFRFIVDMSVPSQPVMSVDDISTGIKHPEVYADGLSNEWFTLSGIKIERPHKAGVYLCNGKKIRIL